MTRVLEISPERAVKMFGLELPVCADRVELVLRKVDRDGCVIDCWPISPGLGWRPWPASSVECSEDEAVELGWRHVELDDRRGEAMNIDEYEACQRQIGTLGALVRMLPLEAFLARARRAESVGALLSPSAYIAGSEKLDLIIKLAEKLRAFQAALPTLEQALEIDERATRLRDRLGV